MLQAFRFLVVLATGALLAGCAPSPWAAPGIKRFSLRDRAMFCLHAGISYEANPAVRVEAVEALESVGGEASLPWIRAALMDEHPAVRFAACLAVGRRGDAIAERALRRCLDDDDSSVQVAALFAMHRLGHREGTGRIPSYLLHGGTPTVRRNAALILGLLGEPTGVKVLARSMRDPDDGVRQHALEAMARLGNREARQELVFMTNAGVGSEETFAVSALAETGDRTYLDTFRYKLATASHLETRLAAARALGELGLDEGLDVAIRALRTNRPQIHDPNDPASGQILRIRQLAAEALGAIGRAEALPGLEKLMEEREDPRVQISGARAILRILRAGRTQEDLGAAAGHG